MQTKKNHVCWFDIPAVNLDRAIRFYSQVLTINIKNDCPDMPMGVFEHEDNMVSGCIFVDKECKPSAQGPLLYFNVQGRIDDAISQVELNGGKILEPKQAIGPYGFRAVVLDSEGNRIALHSN